MTNSISFRPTLRVPSMESEVTLPDKYGSDDPAPEERLSTEFGPVDEDLLKYFERSRARRMGQPVGRDYPYVSQWSEVENEAPTQRRPRLSTFLAAVAMKA